MHILLDVDSVVADLVSAALKVNNCTQGHDDIWCWDIAQAVGRDSDRFWRTVEGRGVDFWTGLSLYPWSRELVSLVDSVSVNCWTFATRPGNADSVLGKTLWIEKHFPGHKPMIGERKDLMARPGTVLIDDSSENVEAFILSGGAAVLFPQPWNRNYYIGIDRVGYVADCLKGLYV